MKKDEFGKPSTVYRVDDDFLRNIDVLNVFKDIEEILKKDDSKVICIHRFELMSFCCKFSTAVKATVILQYTCL